jgi:hypothetical protein
MFGWLRDALANTSSSTLSYRHSMIPSPFFRQQQNQKKSPLFSPSDDDDETDEEPNDNSFYHNPYHSSGQMNYVDVPQQQYRNEHNYSTYPPCEQTTNLSLDDQIHEKLLLLQQRGNHFQSYKYKTRILPTPLNGSNEINEKRSEEEEEQQQQKEEDEDYGIRTYYPGQYPNFDGHFDFPTVVLWYRNVMQSVKKFM